MNIEEAIQAVKEEHELDGEHKVSAAVIVAAVEAVTDEDVHLTIDDIKYERNVTDGTEQLVDAEDVTSEVSVDTVVEKPAFRRESTTGSDNQQQHQHEKKAQDEHDPYSMFQVESHVCDILYVNVMEGKNITNGTFNDLVDTPDPYVQLCIFEAPDSLRTTDTSSNTSNPQWFETFKFLLYQEPKEPTLLKISLMDSDLNADDTMGAVEFDVNEIKIGDKIKKTFMFPMNAEIEIEFRREVNTKYDVRYSLALCQQEKAFRKRRRTKVTVKMAELLKDKGPSNLRETPCVAVIGSGGGYRAAVGFSGAIRALDEIGIFDCATYAAGLSGSTWCLSSLYSHKSFPDNGVEHAVADMRTNISKNLLGLLKPSGILRCVNMMRHKRKTGQPCTLTDFFGLIVGKHMLGEERMDARLTDFIAKIEYGQAPMPMMTALHIRPDVSALEYHEWLEFTPYEVGMAKYGCFVKTPDFNNKFFMGVISKDYPEAPLHYLMGIWGSAFAILFDRLVTKANKPKKPKEKIEESEEDGESKVELEAHFDRIRGHNLTDGEVRDDNSDTDDDDDELPDIAPDDYEDEHPQQLKPAAAAAAASEFPPEVTEKQQAPEAPQASSSTMIANVVASAGAVAAPTVMKDYVKKEKRRKQTPTLGFFDRVRKFFQSCEDCTGESSSASNSNVAVAKEESIVKEAAGDTVTPVVKDTQVVQVTEEAKDEEKAAAAKPSKIKNTILHSLMESKLFSREYRAGKIFNFMRGLHVTKAYPLAPFSSVESELHGKEFSRLDETISGKKKKVFLVDAGLAFNSPYPAVLRPQRFVDLIISFDLSARDKEDMDPFGELRLAEKWANIHGIPFPKIDYEVYDREGIKELYIFKDAENVRAPIILHFCLCNKNFRDFSAPGVPREADDSRGDFQLFTEDSPFSTFDFQYEDFEFNQLHELIRFNTLNNKDKILQAIAECVELRTKHETKHNVSHSQVHNSVYLSNGHKERYSARQHKV